MSEWAYRKCEKCGNRVHINSTCKTWESDCDGDPWHVRSRMEGEMEAISRKINKHKKKIGELEDKLVKKMKELSKI